MTLRTPIGARAVVWPLAMAAIAVLAALLFALVGSAGRAAAADCKFVLGFQALHALIPDTVGACVENEQHDPNQGVTVQRTTHGLLVWQKATNHTSFTDGYRTWVLGPLGLQQRLNTAQFDWERDLASASCQLIQGEPGRPGEVELHVEVIVDGLEIPWGLAILPSGDLLVTERPGRVRLIQAGEIVPEPVLEFGVSILPPLGGHPIAGSEGGLLGLLLHPEFATNRQFYVFYNIDNADGQSVGRIERYALSDDGRSATLDRLIIDGLPAGLHHQGGRMRLGPDGMLYVGVGAYDPPEAQNPDVLAGKLLRMDLEGGIPSDNPDPDSYIFASGIRNTQGYDWFDDQHIVMVDHGPSGAELGRPDLAGFDEVNVVTAGDNLGWPRVWGCDTQEGLVSPVLAWEGSVPPTGATFYRGDLIPEWTDSFLFTTVGLIKRFTGRAMHGRHLHRVVFDQDDPYTILDHEVYLRNTYGRLRTIVSDADGYLYLMTSNCDNRGTCPPEGDKILRIGPAR